MWRTLILAGLLAIFASTAGAATGTWEVCRGPAPAVTECRPLTTHIDPQGRQLWLRAPVLSDPDAPRTLHLVGAMSTEVWFNGAKVGANGQPGPTPAAEQPGRYHAEFTMPDA